MRRELIGIAKSFKSRDDFMIISHTIDPENDSIEVLKTYSETTEIPSKKWQFVRSSELNTKKQANQYMTNFNPNEDGTDFYHSSYVVLVDKNQQIRGFYNILVVEEVKRLKKDVEILLTN
jgi:protein SCO1/2